MLTIENSNCEYYKIKSEHFPTVFTTPGNYKIYITGSKNNCDTIYTKEYIVANPGVEAGICSNSASWTFNLKPILDNANLEITAITIKNMLLGTTGNVLITPYTPDNACYLLNGNEIDTCSMKADLVAAFITYFTALGLAEPSIDIVDNILYICDMPANFVMQDITVVDGFVTKTDSFMLYGNTDFFYGSESIYVKPSFFGDTEVLDGVYKFKIKILDITTGSYVEQENCSFIDCTTKCLVAKTIESLIDEEKVAINVHMTHYALINASNCGCNCKELFELFKYLSTQINLEDTYGCQTCQ